MWGENPATYKFDRNGQEISVAKYFEEVKIKAGKIFGNWEVFAGKVVVKFHKRILLILLMFVFIS